MSIFNLHSNVLADYRDFVRSFFSVADDRARAFIERELVAEARLWPEALLQVSPSYESVATSCATSSTWQTFTARTSPAKPSAFSRKTNRNNSMSTAPAASS